MVFIKISVDLGVEVAKERLKEDASLGQRTFLPVEDIIHLLSICLKTTQFTYNRTYFQQVFGLAMNMPISAVIANMVMDNVEQRALTTSPVKPFLWKQYVDDVISAERLLSHLNSVEPFIQFTLKHEKDRHLTFLDLNVHRGELGNLEANVYYKPTHTEKYLAVDSHHHICHKKSVAKILVKRAEGSSLNSKAKERRYVSNVLKANGFTKTFLCNC